MGDNTILEVRSPLLPDRHPQQDFFVCDVLDAAPKGDMASMEHPLFSISTKPDMKAREYRNGSTFVRVFSAIRAKEVLTLNRLYFRLRKPLERRLYEIARKHCGWPGKPITFHLETLQKKCGSKSTDFEFRRLIKTITKQDSEHTHFPDYAIAFDDLKDQVTFTPRRKPLAAINNGMQPLISDRGREGGQRVAPGYDIYALEEDFMVYWYDQGCKPLKSADAAFIGFCRSKAKRQPLR